MVTAYSCSSLGEEETMFFVGGEQRGDWGEGVDRAARFQAGHLLLVRVFFSLGPVSQLLNGGSDLSVLTDRSPCVGKSRGQRVGAFTC